jgi:D-tagatose-1,6-bisphosphate aldolase subunit GatZ/KbaZ
MSLRRFAELAEARSRGVARGLFSVCSSHPTVIEAALRRAARTGHPVLIEATANQVNQEGGYTGMKADDFALRLRDSIGRAGVDPALVVFGGDHLGPWPWRSKPAEEAMGKAHALVRSFVRAGATKVHLDASMALGGDAVDGEGSMPLDPETAAERSAALCLAAEDEAAGLPDKPVYIIGTEVPVPGGVAGEEGEAGPLPTAPEQLAETLEFHRSAFLRRGLGDAWARVVAVVAQPGLEFDAQDVFPFDKVKAAALLEEIRGRAPLVIEGHSTDYQSRQALRGLVEGGVAILKVGPALTFALREALFGLAQVEAELEGRGGSPRLIGLLESVMRGHPGHWKGYYPEDDRVSLLYGWSDRLRYYWDRPEVASEVERLFAALDRAAIPSQLLSQYIPHLDQSEFMDAGTEITARAIPRMVVDTVLERYESACFPAE